MIPLETSTLQFYVNGKKVIDDNVDPETTLLHYLRTKLYLTGAKLGCGEGGCGACTVMVSKYDRKNQKLVHNPVNACLAPVASMHGLAVTTVEGIGSTETKLHPVQERIAKAHGSQCGFCTPGIVMSMYTLLRNSPKPSMDNIEVALQGNLCRCTGYRAIIDGFKSFTEDYELMQNAAMIANANGNGCAMGDKCCKNKKLTENGCDKKELCCKNTKNKESLFVPYDDTQEPIFPPELKVSDSLDLQSLYFKGEHVAWYRPTHLKDLLELKSNYPDAKIVVGNSEVGVEVKFKHFVYPVIIQPTLIPEMSEWHEETEGIHLGAAITLQEMENILNDQMKTLPEYKTRVFKEIIDMLHWFAGKQIRSVAAVGGNIMTGSPISDLNPIFMAANIKLHLQSKQGSRTVVMNSSFFTGYRKNIVNEDEILIAITIPYTRENQYFFAYKQARRRDDDIAIVNSAINVTLHEKTAVIEDIKLAFGGMAPTTVMAPKTQKVLIGLKWNEEMLEKVYPALLEDLPLSPSAPGGMIQFRRILTLSFFFRTYLKLSKKLNINKIEAKDLSAIDSYHYTVPKSAQYYQVLPDTDENDTVGRPIQHKSSFKQAAGEAIYVDDIPKFHNEVYMALVYSTKSYANILSIDATEALAMKDVVGFVSAKDIPPERNHAGPVFYDEEVFISKTVTSQGQAVGAVLANNQSVAQRAARAVKVTYEELQPVIITIEDAIANKSYFPVSLKTISNGDAEKALAESKHVIEGECRTGYQEHFYFETQSVVVVPRNEDNEFELYSSTQHPSEINKLAAHVLGVPQNRIVTKTKRIGGGFGGKESKGALVALTAIVAAHKYKRPVRIMLDRDEDMAITGGRHPFYFTYKVGFDDEGLISAMKVEVYSNAGYSHDLSVSVLERALFHINNAYKVPNLTVKGHCCKTNLPSNTAFRGFGAPQGMFAAECMIRDIADYLKKDSFEISRKNLIRDGDVMHYSQRILRCTLDRCWDECVESCQYQVRKAAVEKFNSNNRYKKRGIAVIPTAFGISFTAPFLNQGGALIVVYADGSVLLNHGGIEMGQGIHTKMIQIAGKALGIHHEKIHIVETSVDKVPNTSATAASAGSDLNGMAVLEACEKINARLAPVKEKLPNGTWENWTQQAYMDRISLSATGFYKTPDIGYNFATNSGMAFNYYTFGVAITEVEIDCLTGDHQVLRSDIVMDLGDSLNPAIDVGQIEGGFMQGYGLFVLEEMVYSPTGNIFTKGPGSYKIPGFGDIPIEFNVSLLKGAPNPRAVYSSKAVGEPPLFLASSVLFAIREAIKSARQDAGLTTSFSLDAPATAAKIRMNCPDHLTAKIKEPEKGTFVPWNVVA